MDYTSCRPTLSGKYNTYTPCPEKKGEGTDSILAVTLTSLDNFWHESS